nr:MAG TPA: hypothetical protein [Bacteriophage sp.]
MIKKYEQNIKLRDNRNIANQLYNKQDFAKQQKTA